jgi:hypothetical protein
LTSLFGGKGAVTEPIMGMVEPVFEMVAEIVDSGQGLDDLLFSLEAVDMDDNRFIQEFRDLERAVAGRGHES